jgi:hypothetical protein
LNHMILAGKLASSGVQGGRPQYRECFELKARPTQG